jgi:hypothetical protein
VETENSCALAGETVNWWASSTWLPRSSLLPAKTFAFVLRLVCVLCPAASALSEWQVPHNYARTLSYRMISLSHASTRSHVHFTDTHCHTRTCCLAHFLSPTHSFTPTHTHTHTHTHNPHTHTYTHTLLQVDHQLYARADVERLRRRLVTLQSANERFVSQICDLRAQRADEASVSLLAHDQLSGELHQLRRQHKRMQTQHQRASQRERELRRQNERLLDQLEEVRERAREAEVECAHRQQLCDRLELTSGELSREVTHLWSKLSAATADLTACKRALGSSLKQTAQHACACPLARQSAAADCDPDPPVFGAVSPKRSGSVPSSAPSSWSPSARAPSATASSSFSFSSVPVLSPSSASSTPARTRTPLQSYLQECESSLQVLEEDTRKQKHLIRELMRERNVGG